MSPVAEVEFDLSDGEAKMAARLFAPVIVDDLGTWGCTLEIEAPIAIRQTIFGDSSMQALVLALRTMATYLYASEEYRNKEFGFAGEMGGNLYLPAPTDLLQSAPYPF